ncbi:MAG: helicase C-terminal domain-containing protein [Promethearchaeota archaeon]
MEELRPLAESFGVTGVVFRGRMSSCLNHLVTRHASSASLAFFVCSQLKRTGRCQYYQNLVRKMRRDGEFALKLCRRPYKGSELRRVCQQNHVCPYEVAKLVLPNATLVATTYFQIFDSEIGSVFLNAFGKPLSRTVLILDEVHNLPRIAIELTSTRLSLHTIQQTILEAKRYGLDSFRRLGVVLEHVIEDYLQDMRETELLLDPLLFNRQVTRLVRIQNLSNFAGEMVKAGERLANQLVMEGKPAISYVHSTGNFLLRWCMSQHRADVAYFISRYNSNSSAIHLELVALDPRWATQPILKGCHSSIHLSGTLQPITAHIDLVGLPRETQILQLPSPFSRNHVICLISLGVTTAMKHRSPDMFRKIAERISEVSQATPHNVGVFVPSYSILQALLANGLEALINKQLFYERPGLSSSKNDRLVKEFKSKADEGALLLGVLGGRNSEGEDYPGQEMETVVVVGVPYARPSPRETVRIQYFEHQFPSKGRDYGYVLPALRCASQAAGRSVRRLDERGAIVFLDDRYTTSYCNRFLPARISEELVKVGDADGLLFHHLETFFGSSN